MTINVWLAGPVDWGDQLIEGTSWLRGPVDWGDQLTGGTIWLRGASCFGCWMKWLPGQRQKTDRVLAHRSKHVTILLATPILLSFLSTYDGPRCFNILQTKREPDQVQSMFWESWNGSDLFRKIQLLKHRKTVLSLEYWILGLSYCLFVITEGQTGRGWLAFAS